MVSARRPRQSATFRSSTRDWESATGSRPLVIIGALSLRFCRLCPTWVPVASRTIPEAPIRPTHQTANWAAKRQIQPPCDNDSELMVGAGSRPRMLRDRAARAPIAGGCVRRTVCYSSLQEHGRAAGRRRTHVLVAGLELDRGCRQMGGHLFLDRIRLAGPAGRRVNLFPP